MREFLSDTVKNIPPSGIRKFFDVVAESKDVLSLGVGEPDFITPWDFCDAGIRSIKSGKTQYTSNWGLLPLREAVSEYLHKRFSLSYSPRNEIIVTVGASEGIDISLRAVINPGDEILIPEPSYVSYSPIVRLCGGVPVPVNTDESCDFKLLPENVEKAITEKTKAVIFPYPNNPTGAIMEKSYLDKLLPVIIKHDLLVISDEIYAELTYDTDHVSIASLPGMRERTILISGFSKAFAMTGWRVGYVCAPKEMAEAMCKIHQYIIMCASTSSQYAALYALEDGLKYGFSSVKYMRDEYNKRRRFMVKAFNSMGLKTFEPKGAFYVFPGVESTGMDGETFATDLLKKGRIAVVPGNAFGSNTSNFFRASYAYSMKNLGIATERIALYLDTVRK